MLIESDLAVKLTKINQLIMEFTERAEAGQQFKQSVKLSLNDVDDAIKHITAILHSVKTLKEYKMAYILVHGAVSTTLN